MPKFIVGEDGFDIHPTGAVQSVYPWLNGAIANGPVIATGGVFGGNQLSFPNNGQGNAVKLAYLFDTTIRMLRANTNSNGSGLFSLSFWFKPGTDLTAAVPIIGFGNVSGQYNLMGYSNAGNGVLIFPSDLNNINNAPVTFNLTNSDPVWITLTFAFWAPNRIVATYAINTYKRKTNYQLTWSTDVLGATGLLDRVVFYQGSYNYSLDDVIVQAVSGADSNWPVVGAATPNPGDIGILNPRQITKRVINANGAINTWEPSTAPNYTAATTAGQYVETDSDTNGVDLYGLAAGAVTGVDAVVIKGDITGAAGLVQAIQSPSASIGGIANINTHRGTNGFVAVAETDGVNPWTAASINAAQFGMKG